ncbi:Salicylate hydroxylase [Madurella fahalii]|uniref:Salicylate hydroxylase n=1 Tax=Madurella fahalii TaxID=1157608 RepID=A0ABQ0G431_9PEZI
MGSNAPRPGRAGVVGAGIAGLSAAIALRRAGWEVEMFEKSHFKNEIGAAITVTPNATMVLDRWGFDMKKAAPVPNQVVRLAHARDLTVFQREEYTDMVDLLGHGTWSFHRVDLHRGLKELATAQDEHGEMGPPVEIRLGCEATGVDCDDGTLRLAGGQVVAKDLIIIADGAHSRLISDFTGHPSGLHRTGRSIYRWLVSMDDVLADPTLRAQFTNDLPGFIGWRDPDKNILWVSYTCRGGKVLNNAVVHTTKTGEGEEDVWHTAASQDQVLATLENFHPSVRKIVTMASEDGIKVHHLYKKPVLTSFVRGRTAVVGDAAHVMMPTHAAGGGIAIESAASLEVLFRQVDATDDQAVKQRLRAFDKLRIPRCNLTTLASNAGPEWLHVPGVEEEIRRFYTGPLPPPGALPYSKPFREVLFHHDEYRAAEQMLARTPSLGEQRSIATQQS